MRECAADIYTAKQRAWLQQDCFGHHYDDVIETILMGMLYGAQMQTMMPKLHSTNFEGMELIRPLYLIREDDIKNGVTAMTCTLFSVHVSLLIPAAPAVARTHQSVWK